MITELGFKRRKVLLGCRRSKNAVNAVRARNDIDTELVREPVGRTLDRGDIKYVRREMDARFPRGGRSLCHSNLLAAGRVRTVACVAGVTGMACMIRKPYLAIDRAAKNEIGAAGLSSNYSRCRWLNRGACFRSGAG